MEIHWLHNVVLDIQRARGKQGSDRLPDRDRCSFFYPQQTNRAKLRVDRKCPASLEMLTSPWIILQFDSDQKGMSGLVLYIREPEVPVEAFLYILDYLRLHELLSSDRVVRLKSFDGTGTCATNLQKAKLQYMQQMISGNSDDRHLSDIINSIRFDSMNNTVSQFSSVALGMEYAH